MDEKAMINTLFDKYNKMTFTKKECAKLLGVSVSTIDYMGRRGQIKSLANISKVYFSIQELARYLTNSELKC